MLCVHFLTRCPIRNHQPGADSLAASSGHSASTMGIAGARVLCAGHPGSGRWRGPTSSGSIPPPRAGVAAQKPSSSHGSNCMIHRPGEFAAGDTSVDTGGEFTKPAFLSLGTLRQIQRDLRHFRQYATSVRVSLGQSGKIAMPALVGRQGHILLSVPRFRSVWRGVRLFPLS